MKTSNFSKSANNPQAIAISAFIPKWINRTIPCYLPLAPNADNLIALKCGQMGSEEYDRLYREQLSKLDPKKVYLDLVGISGPDSVLLCYCSSKIIGGCHRHLVAEWFKEKLLIEVGEL